MAGHTIVPKIFPNKRLMMISWVLLAVMVLAVLQDLFESLRSGYVFHLSESLLFKTTWLLFIPMTMVLDRQLRKVRAKGPLPAIAFVIASVVIHCLTAPVVSLCFSVLFFDGRYDLYKFFSYGLANDLYNLVIGYAGFVFFHRYFVPHTVVQDVPPEQVSAVDHLVVSNGKTNTIVRVDDVICLTSATPYVCIHLKNQTHLHSETLKAICATLDSTTFVRIHKTTVVNMAKVDSFKSRLNGDYDVRLTDGETVRLSRTYAAEFKRRLRAGHRDNL